MAYASVMAAFSHYEAAAITMYNWIETFSRDPAAKTVAGKWYLLRARFAQTMFVEEWIRERGAAASSSLREYHIDNLSDIIEGMKSFKLIAALSQRNGDYKW